MGFVAVVFNFERIRSVPTNQMEQQQLLIPPSLTLMGPGRAGPDQWSVAAIFLFCSTIFFTMRQRRWLVDWWVQFVRQFFLFCCFYLTVPTCGKNCVWACGGRGSRFLSVSSNQNATFRKQSRAHMFRAVVWHGPIRVAKSEFQPLMFHTIPGDQPLQHNASNISFVRFSSLRTMLCRLLKLIG